MSNITVETVVEVQEEEEEDCLYMRKNGRGLHPCISCNINGPYVSQPFFPSFLVYWTLEILMLTSTTTRFPPRVLNCPRDWGTPREQNYMTNWTHIQFLWFHLKCPRGIYISFTATFHAYIVCDRCKSDILHSSGHVGIFGKNVAPNVAASSSSKTKGLVSID